MRTTDICSMSYIQDNIASGETNVIYEGQGEEVEFVHVQEILVLLQ